jgi:hypothetical protein
MLERMLVAALFNLAVLALCLWRPNAGRIFLGLFFVVMAIGVHVVLVLTAPALYLGFGAAALLSPYRWLFDTVVAWNPVFFGLFAAAFELTLALLMLSKGRYARAGLIVSGLFMLVLMPLGYEVLPNILLAAALFYLATKQFDASLWELLLHRGQRHAQPPARTNAT